MNIASSASIRSIIVASAVGTLITSFSSNAGGHPKTMVQCAIEIRNTFRPFRYGASEAQKRRNCH